jgi:hypothetical protein
MEDEKMEDGGWRMKDGGWRWGCWRKEQWMAAMG